MTSQGIAPDVLRDQLDGVGADLNVEDAAGYAALDTQLNLNALAIGLGLENIAYEPEQFPGRLYHLDEPQVTVVLLSNGVLATVDGTNTQAVRDAIRTTIERGKELGLVDIDSMPSVNIESESIPITDELAAGQGN